MLSISCTDLTKCLWQFIDFYTLILPLDLSSVWSTTRHKNTVLVIIKTEIFMEIFERYFSHTVLNRSGMPQESPKHLEGLRGVVFLLYVWPWVPIVNCTGTSIFPFCSIYILRVLNERGGGWEHIALHGVFSSCIIRTATQGRQMVMDHCLAKTLQWPDEIFAKFQLRN